MRAMVCLLVVAFLATSPGTQGSAEGVCTALAAKGFTCAAEGRLSKVVPNGHDGSEQLADISPPEGARSSSGPTPLRAIIVSRVSTTPQAGADKASRKLQVDACRRAAEAAGYTIVKVIEIAVSGAKAEAPHLALITRMADKKQAEAVFFYNGDRSFRDTELGLAQLKKWKTLGLKVFWGSREIDIEDADTKMTTTVELAFSSHKRDKLSHASKYRHHYAKTEGRWYASAPLGYTLTSDRKLLLNPEVAVLVIELFRNVADHMAFSAITMQAAKKLRLTLTKLSALIANPIYKGVIRLGRQEYAYEADGLRPYRIVDDDLWEKAQAGLRRTRGWQDKQELLEALARDTGEIFLVDAMIRAGKFLCDCGKPFHYNGVKHVRRRDVPQLICSGGHSKGIVTAKDFDDAVNPHASCFECRAMRKSDFVVVPISGGFRVVCERCGWRTRTRRHPFAKPASDAPRGGDRRLDEFD